MKLGYTLIGLGIIFAINPIRFAITLAQVGLGNMPMEIEFLPVIVDIIIVIPLLYFGIGRIKRARRANLAR